MKTALKRLRKLSWTERSGVVLLALMLLMITLAVLSYRTHREVLAASTRIRVAHDLSVLAWRFNEVNFHSQVDFWSYVYWPTPEKLDHFLEHEADFMGRFEEASSAFRENRAFVDPEAIALFDDLGAEIPVIRGRWHRIMGLIEKKRPTAEIRRAVVEAKEYFDEIEFDHKVDAIIRIHSRSLDESKSRIAELILDRGVMGGIFLALFLSGFAAIFHRIALKQKQSQLQLVQASKLASLGELSAGVAHELNGPLMIVKGFNSRTRAALIREGVSEDSSAFDSMREIDEGIERMRKIIQHFRDFSRQTESRQVPLSVNAVVHRSLTLLCEQFRLRDILILLDLSTEDPVILGDPHRLEQVILNLLGNARDALDARVDRVEKTVEVRTFLRQGEVVLEVEDNGEGIRKEHMARLFDPFFTTKPVGKGTGLGLAISQGIVRDFGGEIKIVSRRGEGALVTIRFAAHQQAESRCG